MSRTCKDHPRYKAIYRPRCDCKQCWKIWEHVQNRLKRTT